MKHLFVLLTLLLSWSGVQAQTEKQTVVSKLPGEENLSLRERAERDFLMPVRRKKVVAESPKTTADESTAAPESDATARYTEGDEANPAAVPAHTTRSYEARNTEALAARRAAARREEARAEARAVARRHAARSSSKSKSHSSKSKSKSKSAANAKSSKSKSKSSKAKSLASSKKSSAKKSSAKKSTAKKSSAKKSSPSKSKSSSKSKRRR